ncbi:MAG: hypothetical protein U0073_01290 [Bacteroidia bacterium]
MNSFFVPLNRLPLIQVLFFVFLLSGCSDRHEKNQEKKSVTPGATTQEVWKANSFYPSISSSAGNQLISVYLPSSWNEKAQLPALLFFDPHADGSLPVSKYKGLAEKYNVILIGSNTSENGMNFDQSNAIAGSMSNDAILRFKASSQNISVAGFSGGAKAALAAASMHPEMCSVVYCGAAFPAGNIQTLPPALGFAGINDMNFTEVEGFDVSLDNLSILHALDEWNGKHEWPDSSTFELAFIWTQLSSATVSSQIKKNLCEKYLDIQKSKLKSKDVLVREKTLKQMCAFNHGNSVETECKKELAELEKNPILIKRKKEEEKLVADENMRKQQYVQAFEAAPLTWWESEVKRLKGNKENASDQRLLGFISLAAYSFSSNGLKQENLAGAEKAIAVYGIADPENSEQPFLEACLLSKKNQPDLAIASIKKSVQLGINRRSKIENEADFAALRSRADFQEILSGLKNP